MSEAPEAVHSGDGRTGSDLGSVTAVILTHMRPTLASDLTRSLIEVEGLAANRIVVVVNGVGGLDDPVLESRVRMLRLPENIGPAGGFKAGMIEAFSDPATRWAYLCEDDIGLLPLPAPRLRDLIDRINARGAHHVGAVVAFGRNFARRGAHTVNIVPPEGTPQDLAAADVGSWGATVVSRSVFDAGVVPDTDFGISASRTSTTTGVSLWRVTKCWLTAWRLAGWPPSKHRLAERKPFVADVLSMSTKPGGPTTTPGTPSRSLAVMGIRAGTPGTWPIQCAGFSWPQVVPSGRRSLMDCGTVCGVDLAKTPATAGEWVRSTREQRLAATPPAAK